MPGRCGMPGSRTAARRWPASAPSCGSGFRLAQTSHDFHPPCPLPIFDEEPGSHSMLQRSDFISQDFFRDPAAGIARLRAAGRVVRIKFPIVGKVWITTTHELAARVLKDSETFTL